MFKAWLAARRRRQIVGAGKSWACFKKARDSCKIASDAVMDAKSRERLEAAERRQRLAAKQGARAERALLKIEGRARTRAARKTAEA